MEHNNKFLRFNREHHSRKSSPTKSLQDIFMRSLYSCYPKVSVTTVLQLAGARLTIIYIYQQFYVMTLFCSYDFDSESHLKIVKFSSLKLENCGHAP